MTKEEFIAQITPLIDAVIALTTTGSLEWARSNYSPLDLEPSARILECYTATSEAITFYVYKRAGYPVRGNSLFLNTNPIIENVFEVKTPSTDIPVRAPYIPVTDELLLIVAKKAIQAQSADISKITEGLSRASASSVQQVNNIPHSPELLR